MSVTTAAKRETIARLVDARRRKMIAAADELALLAQFADDHAELAETDPRVIVLPGAERLVAFGHEGTPEMAEFAPMELAAAWNVSVGTIESQIGETLDLRHRFPYLWHLIMRLEVPAWVGRKTAQLTYRLPLENALAMDEEVAPSLAGLAASRQMKLIEAAILKFTPVEETETAYQQAMNSRGVWIGRDSEYGVKGVGARMEAADAERLDAQVRRLASILAKGGCDEEEQIRRSIALGLLANPARARDLLQADLLDELPDGLSLEPCPAVGSPGHTCGTVTVDPEKLLPTTQIVVHLTDATAKDGGGLVRVEKLGPMLTGWLTHLTGNTHIKVLPVLDANNVVPSDSYECPPKMRRAIQLRNTH